MVLLISSIISLSFNIASLTSVDSFFKFSSVSNTFLSVKIFPSDSLNCFNKFSSNSRIFTFYSPCKLNNFRLFSSTLGCSFLTNKFKHCAVKLDGVTVKFTNVTREHISAPN